MIDLHEFAAGNEVISQTSNIHIFTFESAGGESKVVADVSSQPGKHVGGSCVGEEPNSGFRHGEYGVLGCNDGRSEDGDAHSAAHSDPVPAADLNRAEFVDIVVEAVFHFAQVNSGLVGYSFLEVGFDVSSCAEGPRACSLKPEALVFVDGGDLLADGFHHGLVEGVETFGTVEGDCHEVVVGLEDDGGFCCAELG